MANLLIFVMGAFAEFERTLIHERQMKGTALAKRRDAFHLTQKRPLAQTNSDLMFRAKSGEQKVLPTREYNISRETFYQYLQDG